ncbi:MAG: hypothetical protein LAP21_09180 [Acidobacteriia bacterium]|nr:hypothetical protein [Terriglobia bacterium]
MVKAANIHFAFMGDSLSFEFDFELKMRPEAQKAARSAPEFSFFLAFL